MKIIDGQNAVLGRVASYAAKQALKGEDIAIVNCKELIITGTKKFIEKGIQERRGRVGWSRQGQRYSRSTEKMVKTAIRGMIPNYRLGRGKIAFEKIKCYSDVPKEFENSEKISIAKDKKKIFVKVKEVSQWNQIKIK